MATPKEWEIIYWSEATGQSSIEKWLDSLTNIQLKSVAKELKMLETCGNMLRLPHSRSLGKGLFELRERMHGFRIYYGFQVEKLIVLLAAGNKKSQERI